MYFILEHLYTTMSAGRQEEWGLCVFYKGTSLHNNVCR